MQNGHGETLNASTVEEEENIVAAAAAAAAGAPVASTGLAAALVIDMKLVLILLQVLDKEKEKVFESHFPWTGVESSMLLCVSSMLYAIQQLQAKWIYELAFCHSDFVALILLLCPATVGMHPQYPVGNLFRAAMLLEVFDIPVSGIGLVLQLLLDQMQQL